MRCARIGCQPTNQQCGRETSKCPAQEGSTERRCELTSSLAGISDGSCRDGLVSVPDLSLCHSIATSGFTHPESYSQRNPSSGNYGSGGGYRGIRNCSVALGKTVRRPFQSSDHPCLLSAAKGRLLGCTVLRCRTILRRHQRCRNCQL